MAHFNGTQGALVAKGLTFEIFTRTTTSTEKQRGGDTFVLSGHQRWKFFLRTRTHQTNGIRILEPNGATQLASLASKAVANFFPVGFISRALTELYEGQADCEASFEAACQVVPALVLVSLNAQKIDSREFWTRGFS